MIPPQITSNDDEEIRGPDCIFWTQEDNPGLPERHLTVYPITDSISGESLFRFGVNSVVRMGEEEAGTMSQCVVLLSKAQVSSLIYALSDALRKDDKDFDGLHPSSAPFSPVGS